MTPARIVEFGAGLGWLSRGLASRFGIPGVMTVDKRPWGGIDILADLETQKGLNMVHARMKDGDVIVMADFLHCVCNPGEILQKFDNWPIVALEYIPSVLVYDESFRTQLARYGTTALTKGSFWEAFHGLHVVPTRVGNYILAIYKA